MKVLFYMSGGFDTHGPSNHLMQSLMEDVLGEGIDVHLIQRNTKGDLPSIPFNLSCNSHFTCDIVKSRPIKKTQLAKRYLNFVAYAIRSRKYLKRVKNVNVIFVQSCPTSFFQISFAKYYIGAPIVYNVQDTFPGSSIASGVMKNKWMQFVFAKVQKLAYKKTEIITVISDDMKDKIKDQNVPESKIRVIQNWFDDKTVHEVDWNNNRFVKKYSLNENYFYVQYAGTMGFVFDYKMVIEVALKLEKIKEVRFQMIGYGSQKNEFIEECKRKNITNIDFYPIEPQHMVSDVYSACSICFIPLKRNVIGNSVPSKIALLMACKRMIISSVDENSKYCEMFNKNKIGIAISNLDSDAVAKSIEYAYENREIVKQYAENSYRYGLTKYSRTYGTRAYIALFNELERMKSSSD